VRSPEAKKVPANLITSIIGPIMGGMLIFFAFFTGGSTSQTILKEQEEGTLSRLFTTPTRISSILGGKFVAVGLTVLVQVVVLLAAARLIFSIQWGDLPSVALTALGIVACATSFGIFLTSFVKSTRQSGIIYGGLMTVTGMLGMMRIFTGAQPGGSAPFDFVSLLMPQGWAVRGLLMGLHGAPLGDAALNLLALLGWSLVFFTAGLLRFQKRFA
jgi:ABC-2 type transport system permease protein